MNNKQMDDNLIPAKDLKRGDLFKKRTGSYTYLRISPSAVKFLGRDPEEIWGVSFNGNVAQLKPDTLVRPVSMRDMHQNLVDLDEWEGMIGCKDRSTQ